MRVRLVCILNVVYQFNDGSWTSANSEDDFAHWSADVTLSPGKNVFRAYAIDSAGDNSRTNALKFRLESPEHSRTNAPKWQINGR